MTSSRVDAMVSMLRLWMLDDGVWNQPLKCSFSFYVEDTTPASVASFYTRWKDTYFKSYVDF
jgi:hypothetical protein